MHNTERLLPLVAALEAAQSGILSISVGTVGDSSTVKVLPAGLQAGLQPMINAFDWSDAAYARWQQAEERRLAQAMLVAGRGPTLLVRGLTLVLLQELNRQALALNTLLKALEGASTLEALHTAVAAIPDLAVRTRQELEAALTQALASGEADA